MSFKFPKKRPAFTLIEIIVVIAIIAMMVVIIVPMIAVSFKRSRAGVVLNDLKTLDTAIHQYATDTEKNSGFNPDYQDLKKYLDKNSQVYRSDGKDSRGNVYGPFTVGAPPKVPENTYFYFSGVVDDSFWSVYH